MNLVQCVSSRDATIPSRDISRPRKGLPGALSPFKYWAVFKVSLKLRNWEYYVIMKWRSFRTRNMFLRFVRMKRLNGDKRIIIFRPVSFWWC
jgi:hypothetical protein